MKALNCQQTRQLEKCQIDRGSSYYELMENAGVQVGKYLISLLYAKSGDDVAIVCGKGNNGGDGFVCAKYLKSQGLNPIILLADGEPRTPDAVRAFNGAVENHITVWRIWESREKVLQKIHSSSFIVDAIYGIGFKGELSDTVQEVVQTINDSNVPVLSIDIPSGAECDTGSVASVAVSADVTVTFSTAKVGQLLYPAMDYCGKIVVAPVGINRYLVSESDYITQTVTAELIQNAVAHHKKSAHKGSRGTLLTVCGSYGMAGAATMCAKAALRSGIGLVQMAIPKSIYSICAAVLPQAVFVPLDENNFVVDCNLALEEIYKCAEKASAIVIGSGLGVNKNTTKIVFDIVSKLDIPMVIDADALNILSVKPEVLKQAKAPVVVTPHPAEMARLCSTTTENVQSNRLNFASSFAKEYHVTVVLKGANTIISSPEGECIVNTTGNNGLGKGGSGDILAGMVGGIICQQQGDKDVFSAAAGAAFCHGMAGDMAAKELGNMAMQPTDMLNYIPQIYKEVFK